MSEHVRLSERTVLVGKATSPRRVTIEMFKRASHPPHDEYPRSLSMGVGDARLLLTMLELVVADEDEMAAAAAGEGGS